MVVWESEISVEYLDTKQREAIFPNMKTTITLDTDMAQRLKEAMHRQGTSFQETLNDALRRGLELSQQPFEVKLRLFRLRSGLDPARLSEMDGDLEIEEFLRKTVRLNEIEK